MTGPTPVDETSNDHERFGAEQLAQDHDAARQTADLIDAAARHLVDDLLDQGRVTSVAERRVLIHDPSVARHSTRSLSSPCFITAGWSHMAVTRRTVDTATARRVSLATDRSSRVQCLDAEADGDRVD